MNTGVHGSFQISVFIFFRYIPSSGIAVSYGSSIFRFMYLMPFSMNKVPAQITCSAQNSRIESGSWIEHCCMNAV